MKTIQKLFKRKPLTLRDQKSIKEPKKVEHIKFKLVIYFFIGFILNLLGVIIGIIWIKFKTKTYRKNKLIALLVGFAFHFIYAFIIGPYILQPIIQPHIDKAFFKQYPEAEAVTTALQQKYPDAKIFVSINEKTLFANETETRTTIFSVQHRSEKLLLTSKQMQDIAKETCSITEAKGKSYDKVSVLSLKYVLPLHLAEVHWAIHKPCNDWKTKDFSDIQTPF